MDRVSGSSPFPPTTARQPAESFRDKVPEAPTHLSLYSLSRTHAGAAAVSFVPETAIWAMMLLGHLGMASLSAARTVRKPAVYFGPSWVPLVKLRRRPLSRRLHLRRGLTPACGFLASLLQPKSYTHSRCLALEHIAWNSPAKLILSRHRPVYSGTLSMCVLHFRDQLSVTRKVTCHIALERDTVLGKTWLGPEEIYNLMTAENLPPELQAAY
jgi:hypothetical protein